MADEITIPRGAIVTSSQDNIRKFNHEDLEYTVKTNKEYKEQKERKTNTL
jgi:hypothetical protein